LSTKCSELDFLGSDISVLERIKPPFHRITYSEAVETLRGEKTREFMQKLLFELTGSLETIEEQIAEAESVLASATKSWQKSAAAAKLQSLSAEKAELETQIENNPRSHDYFFKLNDEVCIMGKRKNPWQDTDLVLQFFDKSQYAARKKYRDFVDKGMGRRRNSEMTGGVLLRSI